MWVVLYVLENVRFLRGITPTYVGSTLTGACIPIAFKDHPHVCG